MEKALMVNEVAEILRLAPKTVYNLFEKGKLEGIKVGGSLRFDPKLANQLWKKNSKKS